MSYPHILYIDNDFESKKKAVILLYSNQYEVLPVSSVRGALSMLRHFSFDLIIADMHLPDGDADHLLHTMRTSKDMADIPIIVVASTFNQKDRERLLNLGAHHYLEKDGEISVYLHAVEETLRHNRKGIRETAGGISGHLAKMKIVDLIFHLAEEHGTGVIHIDGKQQMEIHLRDGHIIHARHGITIGKKALARCLRIAEAAYHFESGDSGAEADISEGLGELLDNARAENEKLMANSHKLPNPNHRVRIINPTELLNANFRPEVRAAIEIIRKYPRVGTYVDRLNLPDITCYEYLISLLERGLVELISEYKPVRIITDSSADLSAQEQQELNVTVVPLKLQLDQDIFSTNVEADTKVLYGKKLKHLDLIKAVNPSESAVRERVLSLIDNYDCLAILCGSGLCNLYAMTEEIRLRLLEQGHNQKTLLADEFVCLDSHAVSIGLGLLVETAARMAKEGASIAAVEEAVINAMARLHMVVAVLPERSILAKKGKEAAVFYWNGQNFVFYDKVAKGESIQAFMVEELRKRIDLKRRLHIALGHVNAPQAAEHLRLALTENFQLRKLPLKTIGPFTGYRLGEGAVAMAYYQE